MQAGLLRKLPMTNRVSVILNEVKNRTVTKGKPTAEILHFVQNDIFFLLSFFACLMLSLGSRNDVIASLT